MLDPDQIAADAEQREWLSANAALVAHFWEVLRDLNVPEALAVAVVRDWHAQYIAPEGVTWEDYTDDDD